MNSFRLLSVLLVLFCIEAFAIDSPRILGGKYTLEERYSKGKHIFIICSYKEGKFGEVWKASENKIGSDRSFIAKKMLGKKGTEGNNLCCS
jgi:hypothetical protein